MAILSRLAAPTYFALQLLSVGNEIRGPLWMDQLSASVIGINLLSDTYLKSGHCLQELRQMVAHRNEGKLDLFSVKLYKEPIDIPSFLSDTQYLRLAEFESAEHLIKKILETIQHNAK